MTYGFNTIPVKIAAYFFVETDLYGNANDLGKTKQLQKRRTKLEDLHFQILKLTTKLQLWYWHKAKHVDKWNCTE